MKTKVILIGGAPGTGKTTLGSALAARFGVTSLTIDDLLTAAQAVTSPESHPGLHIMRGMAYQEYFTNNPVEYLIADAILQHETAWRLVEPVIRKHATWAPAIVIDGWHLRPYKVDQLGFDNVRSAWIVADESVLEERIRNDGEWLRSSRDPEKMVVNFLARSLWFNALIKKQAAALQMTILLQDGKRSAEELCGLVMDAVD